MNAAVASSPREDEADADLARGPQAILEDHNSLLTVVLRD
jgi:hypothetical protein